MNNDLFAMTVKQLLVERDRCNTVDEIDADPEQAKRHALTVAGIIDDISTRTDR